MLKDQLTIEKEKENLFATKGEVEKALSNSSPIPLLIVKKAIPNRLISLPQIKKLLEEFADVFSDELSKGLPPIRGIEHQINLMP